MSKILLIVLLIGIVSVVSSHALTTQERIKNHYQIGDIYYRQGKHKEAKQEYQKALELINQEATLKLRLKQLDREKKETISKSIVATTEYLIGIGDVLKISVWQNSDLDQDAIVRPDGRISFPLVGDVLAAGLTIPELDEELTQRLKDFLKYPEVSISIKKFGGKKVIVLGQVEDPGVYSVTGAKTMLEAIGLAGGFTNHAVSSSIVLIRGGLDSPQAQRINLTKALDRGDMSHNIALESEDIIFVPKKFIADLNYFLNQILAPISRGTLTFNEIESWYE